MVFRTEIEIPPSKLRICHRQRHLMIGSCFAENMGEKLVENKFDVEINPFGIVYNPWSAARILSMLLDKYEFSEDDILFDKGLFLSLMHHSKFSGENKQDFLKQIRNSAQRSAERLTKTDNLLVTFGTAYTYASKATGQIVNNCHKLPAAMFERKRLTVGQITEQWSDLIQRLIRMKEGIQLLFTVSPIRHWKDGAHDNQLSKSILLLAIEELQLQFPNNVHYFPSYELILDELRDYRFYNRDMIHPNETAIEYCWGRFAETYFDDQTRAINSKWQALAKALAHRPFRTDSEEHQSFLKKTWMTLEEFTAAYPTIDCMKEIDQLKNSII